MVAGEGQPKWPHGMVAWLRPIGPTKLANQLTDVANRPIFTYKYYKKQLQRIKKEVGMEFQKSIIRKVVKIATKSKVVPYFFDVYFLVTKDYCQSSTFDIRC